MRDNFGENLNQSTMNHPGYNFIDKGTLTDKPWVCKPLTISLLGMRIRLVWVKNLVSS